MTSIRTYLNAYLIYNPNAGKLRRHPRLVEAALRRMDEHGHKVTPRPTSGPGDATVIAKECLDSGADLILAAGGDGTINEVANGMIGSAVPLGIIPAGTANVLAMEMRLGGNAMRGASLLREMEPVRIGAGLVSEMDGTPRRHFLLMAGAGLDAHIVASLNPGLKNMLGKVAYWSAGFSSLLRRLEELDAKSMDARVRCSFALASRVRNYGGDLEIALGASLLKEHFEVMMFEGSNPFRYLMYLTGVLFRNAASIDGVTVSQTQHITLEPFNGNRVLIQVDGEDGGVLPAQLKFIPNAITLLMPPQFVAAERQQWKI